MNKKGKIKTALAALILSFVFTGCDSAGSGSSSIATPLPDDNSPVVATDDNTIIDVTNDVTDSQVQGVTSARGEAPPGPPIIISD